MKVKVCTRRPYKVGEKVFERTVYIQLVLVKECEIANSQVRRSNSLQAMNRTKHVTVIGSHYRVVHSLSDTDHE
jgi:hypothetical protein